MKHLANLLNVNGRHCYLVLLVAIFSLSVISDVCVRAAGRPPPPPVQINKCCRFGEHLERTAMCVVGGPEKWVPTVFMMAKSSYFEPRGSAPRFFKIQESKKPNTCQNPELFTGHNKLVIFSNGSLYLTEKAVFVPSEDYCVEKESALVCFPEIHGVDSLVAPKKLSKVRKCCYPQMGFDESLKSCILLKDHVQPGLNFGSVVNSSSVEIIYGFPECEHYAIVGKFRYDLLDVETGSLVLESGKTVQSNDFCLEHTFNAKNITDIESPPSVNMLACSQHFRVPEPVPKPKEDVHHLMYSIGLFISVIFLSATLAAGFLMPSNHHVLHWRCQTYYVVCLLVGDLLLAITQVFQDSITGITCITMAIFMHFFFLAAFFWLNTMCFNIWWTFRDFRPTSLEKGQELFRLRIYMGYAIGVPLIISLVAAIVDQIPQGPDDHFLRPRFGEVRCWFYGDMEILTYFFGPIGILLFINILLFASTARQLTCGLWKRDDVKSTTERAALGRVCLKLVIVMGVTWVTDIISWLVGGPSYVWYFTDLINAFQGVFIFIVVGCQPQVWSALKRIWSSKTGRGVTNTTNGPQHSSSSHGLPSIGETITNNTLTHTTSTKVPMETVC